jgi:Holliday junction resolvase RusA-like endonuclease
MRTKTYIIGECPTALQRVRFAHGKVYDSQKSIKLVNAINLQRQHNNEPFFEGPLFMEVTFFMPIPKTRLRYVKSGATHSIKPDLDNMIKYICDVSNKVIYHDDAAIVHIIAKKVYDLNPRTEFTVSEVKSV